LTRGRPQRVGAYVGRHRVRQVETQRQQAARFADMRMRAPEALERADGSQCIFGATGREKPVEGGGQIVVFALEAVQPADLVWAG
jgi:hypothetical protein